MTTGAGSVSAQCVTTQDCAALGYTDSACPGSGVKCPFGMIKAAQALERVGAVKLVTANINLVVVIRVINTPAPAPATRVVWERLVVVSIPNAIVQVIIVGMVAVVLFLVHQATNTLAPVQAIPEAQAPLAAVNIPPVSAPAVMNGKMVVARNKHRMEQLASCIIAMAKLLVYVLQV